MKSCSKHNCVVNVDTIFYKTNPSYFYFFGFWGGNNCEDVNQVKLHFLLDRDSAIQKYK